MSDDRDPSRLRQKLRHTEEERVRHLERLLAERGPLIRGTYVAQPGRCGKPTCKCARGEFHASGALYTRHDGRATCSYVPLSDRQRVEALNGHDRDFRKARAALAKLGKQTVELACHLEDALAEPYPPPERVRQSAVRPRKTTRRKNPSS